MNDIIDRLYKASIRQIILLDLRVSQAMLCDSLDEIQQQQLQDELSFINEHINMRSGKYPHIQDQTNFPWNDQYEHKTSQKIVNQACFFTHSNQNQYFSEIGRQESQQDSLFDQQQTFADKNQHFSLKRNECQNSNKSFGSKKQHLASSNFLPKSKKKSQPEIPRSKSKQILKEQDYIYRKQRLSSSKLTVGKSVTLPPPKPKNTTFNKIKQQKQNMMQNNNNQAKYGSNSLSEYLRQCNGSSNSCGNIQNDVISQEFISNYLKMLTSSSLDSQVLTDKSHSKLKKCQSSYQTQDIKQCTFKPTILKKSQQIAKNNKPIQERLSTSIQRPKSPYQPMPQKSKPNLQRIQKLSQPRTIKTLVSEQVQETPSFRPSLSKKSLQHMSNCTFGVAKRNKLWLEQKQQKIDKMRKQQQEIKAKKQSSMYTPSTTIYKGQQQANFSRFGRQGMVQYFQRVSMAKKKSQCQIFKGDKASRIKTQSTEYSLKNKENISCISNCNNTNRSNMGACSMKKQTYDEAVRSLHSKIMKLKI